MGQVAENDIITPLSRQLCGFPDPPAEIPSYATFCRVCRKLAQHRDLVDATCNKLSQLLAERPWVLPGASDKAKPKGKIAGKGKAKPKGKGRRKGKSKSKSKSNDYRETRLRNGMGILKFMSAFPDEETAVEWLEARRWPEGVRCPRCDSSSIAKTNSQRPKQPYRCRKCRRDFSVKTGTVLHGSNLPVRTWLLAAYHLLKNGGMAAIDLAEELEISVDAAHHLSHRIRVGFLENILPSAGEFQFDETYLGGKKKNQHLSLQHLPRNRDRKKLAVIGSVREADEENGKPSQICLRILESVTKETAGAFVRSVALPRSKIRDDGHAAYGGLEEEYNRVMLNHSAGEYVIGDDSTNYIESIFKVCKRTIYGTYDHVSRKYLHLYLAEIVFRWNHRHEPFMARTELVFGNLMRRRLTQEDMKFGEGLVLNTPEPSNGYKAVQGDLMISTADWDDSGAVQGQFELFAA